MSNSTANFTEQLKQKRLVRERQIEKRIMDELDTIEATSLKQLNAGKSTIVKDTLAWAQRRSKHWMRALLYILPLYLLVIPILFIVHEWTNKFIENKMSVVEDYRTEVKKIAAPGLITIKEDGRLQIQIAEKESKKPEVWFQEKNDRWIVDIWRK